MIRVRRSILELFRECTTTDYGDEAELVAAVRGEPVPPNWYMEAGTAWHAVLENPSKTFDFDTDRHTSGKFSFPGSAVETARKHLPASGLREIPGSRIFPTPLGPVEVTCTADLVSGLTCHDHKTKFSPADPADYEEALQWRFYLAVHGCTEFRYHLWEFRDPDDEGFCALKGSSHFSFWKYPHLERDCAAWCSQFRQWLEVKGLAEFLRADNPAAA
jgi:hypothetical protein